MGIIAAGEINLNGAPRLTLSQRLTPSAGKFLDLLATVDELRKATDAQRAMLQAALAEQMPKQASSGGPSRTCEPSGAAGAGGGWSIARC